jgi:hypothetical protein
LAAGETVSPRTLPELDEPSAVVAALDDRVAARTEVPPPAPAQADPWIDEALSQPQYQAPRGVFDAPAAPSRRPPVLVRALVYAAAGLALGVGGGLIVARLWFAAPMRPGEEAAGARAVATDSRAEAASAGEAPATPQTPLVSSGDARSESPSEGGTASRAVTPASPPEQAQADEPKPAPAQGRLVVRSQPSGALVTIDGRHVGETPFVARGLAPGTYAVRVAHPGHVPRTERVSIGAAAPVRTLEVTLTPGLESAPSAATTATRGAIDVDSRPRGARVIVDGRFVGLAPLRLADVGPGEHQVTLELGGYRSATGRVRVDAGRIAALTTTLRAIE